MGRESGLSSSIMADRTSAQHLADLLLGEPVEEWMAARTAQGISWRFIVRQLAEATDGRVDVTTVTALAWMKASRPAVAERRPA